MSINIGDLLGSLTGGSGNDNPQPQAQAGGGGGGGGGNMLASLLPVVLPMLMNGGLSKILGGLQSKGLTEQVDSWESDKPNEAVSPSQIKEALGQDELDQVAQKAGVSTDEAADGISQLLPQLVNQLSPQGKLPDEGTLGSVLGSLTKQLGS